MDKIKNFLQNNKYVFIWTLCYFTVVWVILRVLFGFNMFLGNHWVRLVHVHLHGFAAFAFGILLLAAVPLYFATTAVIVRTKKPLLTISLPKWFVKKTELVVEENSEQEVKKEENPLPEDLPTELREPFLRARAHMALGAGAQSVFNTMGGEIVNVDKEPVPTEPDLPLPPDFDVDPDLMNSDFGNKSLVFSDVNFDDDNNDDESEDTEKDNIVFDYLTSHGYGDDCVNMGDMVVCRDYAIVWHDDADLWIADEGDTWYGPGKQELSPATRVKAFSDKTGTQPVLYLAATNILNIDTLRKQWSDDGIVVIDDLDEFDKLLKKDK